MRPSIPPPGRRVFHKHSQSEVNYNWNLIFKKYHLIKKRKKKKEEKGGGKEEREKREER